MTDGTEPAIRASDGEREAVIARLNAAVGEGRLDIEEFSERVEVAYASRTRRVEVVGSTMLGTRKIQESAGSTAEGAPVLRLKLDTVVGTVKVYRR
jgi:hypothetical protein